MIFAVIDFPGSSSNDVYNSLKEVLQVEVEIVSHETEDLSAYAGIILPGGFSYGDYLRPGALAKQTKVAKAIIAAAEAGKPVLGISNGFQILIELGLLPGLLLRNEKLKFICKKIEVRVNNAKTKFTNAYEKDEILTLPIAHEQGNYYCDAALLKQLQEKEQIVFTYARENPNGSMENIAAVINERGNVLGMMPQAERAVEKIIGSEDGLKLFQSMINAWRETNVANA